MRLRHQNLPSYFALAATLAVVLIGCGKAKETVTQKAVDKMAESQLEKDGVKNAKVETSQDGMKATLTDKDGKNVAFEIGNAKISEADVGLPFYPGAAVDAKQSSKFVTGDASMVSVTLNSPDKSDKVAGFYRDKLKGAAGGKQFMEMSQGEGQFMLMLNDDKTQSTTQVQIAPQGGGSHLTIIASQKKSG